MTPRGVWARLRWACLVLCGLLLPRLAFAAPRVSLRADAPAVEVGEVLTVTMSVSTDGSEDLTDPTLAVPSGFSLRGPSISSQSSVSIINGKVTLQKGFTATWAVTASKPGTFSIGPGGLRANAKRVKVDPFTVTIHPAGTMSHLKKRPGRLFDPFGGLFPGGPSSTDDDVPPPPPGSDPDPTDAKLSLDGPLQPQAFLRAIIDKTEATVGEQVTLSIYSYTQPRFVQEIDQHEPTAPDFFQRTLATGEDDARMVQVGQQTWRVKLYRRIALFPLRTGDLTTGSMSVTLIGSGFRGGGARGGMVRESKPIIVHVTEPPAAGRPPGYVIGDVGQWSLSATVEPRTVVAGGSIAVTALLKGTGNPPGAIRTPEKKGITWLEPEVRETVDADRPKVTAVKKLTWVVSLMQPGRNDLGELSLPYWDPDKKAYQIAKVALGAIDVTGTAPTGPQIPAAGAVSAAPVEPFAMVAPSRPTLSAYAKPTRPLTDFPAFWGLLLAAPLLVVGLEGATRGVRKLRAAAAASRDASARKVSDALAEAHVAAEAGDKKRAASAVERAVNAAVEEATGKNVRGLLRADMVRELVAVGLPDDLAQAVHDLLARCDTWRFDPEGEAADSPVDEAKALVKRLSRLDKQAKPA